MRNIALCALVALLISVTTAEVASAETCTFYGEGDGYAGQITASGAMMDPSAYAAAHPYYPLGSLVTVCYEGCVTVVVNDRGAVLDLTPAAAHAIGVKQVGIAEAAVTVH
jgi:rare lipoprotein A